MLRKTLTASLLAAAALAPAAAQAAGGSAAQHARLGGQPTMFQVDAHHATLEFAADRLPAHRDRRRRRPRAVRRRPARLRAEAGRPPRHRHPLPRDVTSTSDLRVGAKYTARIRLAGSPAVSRLVKLHAPKGY